MREEKGIRRYLTTTQAARLAHLSPSTLLRAIQDKKLKAFSTPGGHYRIDRTSLDVFLRASGVATEKKRVVLLRLSAAERDELLKEIRVDESFALAEGGTLSQAVPSHPCILLLEISGTNGKKRGKELLSSLRRACGMN